ncbi:unnamed protein product [Urochloa humidicola]
MARAAVVAVLTVAVLLACLPSPAAATSPYRAAAALRWLETAAPMDTALGMREKADVAKVAAENVSMTGYGAESKRFVPTGSNPLHNHGRGPTRHAAAENVSTTGYGAESKRFVPTGSNTLHNHSQGPRKESP